MIPERRQTLGTEELPDAFGIQVPPGIDARIRLTIEQEANDTHDILKDRVRERLEDKVRVLQVGREAFQQMFMEQEIQEPEFETCEVTDRVYLFGTGRPQRETCEIEDKKLSNLPEEYSRDLQTKRTESNDLVFAFTEVTWGEFRRSVDKANELPGRAAGALAEYFDLEPSFVPAILASLDSYSEDQILRIAMYADKNTS
jgi:hypothetical protein